MNINYIKHNFDLNNIQRLLFVWAKKTDTYICMKRKHFGNVLFNDALNTFYLRLYGVGHIVKDHSDSERGNPLSDSQQGVFYMHHPTNRITHTSRGTLAGTRNTSMGPQ